MSPATKAPGGARGVVDHEAVAKGGNGDPHMMDAGPRASGPDVPPEPATKPTDEMATLDEPEARQEDGRGPPDALDQTLAAFGNRAKVSGRLVLLRGKRPFQPDWPNRRPNAAEVRAHVGAGGNVGIRAGDGLVVLDFDDPAAEAEMIAALGPIAATCLTGSGKRHYYVADSGNGLGARILWRGRTVGEVQRTGAQQVVAPPSRHPETGRPYVWTSVPPVVTPLPAAWLTHLTGASATSAEAPASALPVPGFVTPGDTRGTENARDDWDGPPIETIVARALMQPNATLRGEKIRFRCAGCAGEARDRSGDNGCVWPSSGRWACCIAPEHKRNIAVQLGVSR